MQDPVDDCPDSATACPWNDHHSDRWVAAVNEAPWTKLSDTEWLKTLDCPRCGHEMTILYETGVVVVAAIEEFRGLYADAPDVEQRLAEALQEPETHSGFGGSSSVGKWPARCTCRGKHDPAAVGDGCGQFGVIDSPE